MVKKKNIYYEDDNDNEGKVVDIVALGMRDDRRVVCLKMGGSGGEGEEAGDEMLALAVKLSKND